MTFENELGSEFATVISTYGRIVRFRYFTYTYPGAGSYYDDDLTLTQSGTDSYVSGVVLPINGKQGSADAYLMEQGRILMNDSKLYVQGTVNTSGLFRVSVGSPPLGSPTSSEYGLVEGGAVTWPMLGSPIYKRLYIRYLTNGSLAEEG